jgi:3-dehydroquinate synthase
MAEQPDLTNQTDQTDLTNQTDLTVTTPAGSYAVVVAAGALAQLPALLRQHGLTGALWLISDSNVFPHHGAALAEQLRAAGYSVQTQCVPAGEPSKSQQHYWELCSWLLENGVERRDVVLALGGGVVGDLAGFVAATVLRGLAFVQLPTSLLAMVDAAIGGKTGINHAQGKNLIGAFYQPRLVLADTLTLRTLPARELIAGWAEVIKHGVIRDAALFARLAASAPQLGVTGASHTPTSLPEPLTSEIIRQAAAVKVAVVNADEREQGERIILNYGHTLAHALETATGYTTWLHGEAVAIGMHAAAGIAGALGMLPAQVREQQHALLAAYGLPSDFPPNLDPEHMLALTLRDKKVRARRVRWVLPTAIGSVRVRDDVPEAVVRSVMD